jgi:hypothetical protein
MLDQANGVDLKDLISWFKDSPAGQEIAKQRQTAFDDQRKAAQAEIARLRSQLEKTMPPLLRRERETRAKIEPAQKALAKAFAEHDSAYYAARGAELSLLAEIGELEKYLRQHADAVIDSFRNELWGLHKKCEDLHQEQPDRIPIEGIYHSVRRTNFRAIQDRARAILRTIQALDDLKVNYQPEQLAATIQQMRDALPRADKLD